MLTRQDQRQQIREILKDASQVNLEEPRKNPAVAIEIHFHISGPIVVVGTEAVGTMLPALMQLIETAKQPMA